MKTVKNLRSTPRTIAATGQFVKANGRAEVDDDLADALCEQSDTWALAPERKTKTKTSKPVDDGDQQED